VELVEKERGELRWTACLRASPLFASDALAFVNSGRSLFLAIDERRANARGGSRE
jgi:hypothetical protein